jgi:hypothetical protein
VKEKLKILHLAPQNFAGMPYDFIKMHKSFGNESHLVTFFNNTLDFPEDICLNLPSPSSKAAKKWRDTKAADTQEGKLKINAPKNLPEKIYFKLRDTKNSSAIESSIKKYDLLNYDIYHFDGGMDFYRDVRFAKELKKKNKKIVCCYFGSDLRTRGIFKELDEISDLNLTVEFDHLKLYPSINFLFFPFDDSYLKPKSHKNNKLKIVHSPSNRKFKGTDKIIPIMNEVMNERQVEFVLLENMHRKDVLETKAQCDIAIDQIGGELGGSGYGKNSLETISLGLPTVTEFSNDYYEFLGDNPFINSTIGNLKENLLKLIDHESYRNDLSKKGFEWIKRTHSFEAVNKRLMELYSKHKIIPEP